MPYTVYGRLSHKNYGANTEHTRVLSDEGRGGSVLSGKRSGGSSHWGEWRGSGVLSGTRGKATAVSRARRENSKTVAKQKQQPSAGLA